MRIPQYKRKKVIKEEEIEQQAVVDNRLQGDKTNKIYQSYYGVVRNMLDSNKNILFSHFKEDKKELQLLSLQF